MWLNTTQRCVTQHYTAMWLNTTQRCVTQHYTAMCDSTPHSDVWLNTTQRCDSTLHSDVTQHYTAMCDSTLHSDVLLVQYIILQIIFIFQNWSCNTSFYNSITVMLDKVNIIKINHRFVGQSKLFSFSHVDDRFPCFNLIIKKFVAFALKVIQGKRMALQGSFDHPAQARFIIYTRRLPWGRVISMRIFFICNLKTWYYNMEGTYKHFF